MGGRHKTKSTPAKSEVLFYVTFVRIMGASDLSLIRIMRMMEVAPFLFSSKKTKMVAKVSSGQVPYTFLDK